MNRPQLGGRDRRALYAVAGQFFVNGAMTATYVARAPQIRDQIGVEIDEFGLLLTIAASVGMLGSIVAGRVVHAATTRRVLQVGAVVLVLTLPVIGAARGPAVWLAAMCTYMVVDVVVDISMNLQGSWISGRRHAPVMNRLHGVWSLGLFAGGLGAAAANAGGLSPAVHLVAVVAVVMAAVLVAVTRNLLVDDEEGHGAATVPPPARDAPRRARLSGIVMLILAGMFATASEATAGDWAAFRLTDDLGASGARRVGGLRGLHGRHGRHALRRRLAPVAVGAAAPAVGVDRPDRARYRRRLAGRRPDRRDRRLRRHRARVATLMPTLYDDAARLPGRRGAGTGGADRWHAHRVPDHPGRGRRDRGDEPVGR
jgi:hypothetical protein